MNRRQFTKSLGISAATLSLSHKTFGAPIIVKNYSKTTPSDYLTTKLMEVRAKHGVPALSGVLVVNGKVVASDAHGFRMVGQLSGGSTPAGHNSVLNSDRFHLGSLMKVMTGYLLARMVNDGKISWETKIGDVFSVPNLLQIGPVTNLKTENLNIKVMHLMSHTSGLPYQPTTEPKSEWSDITMVHGPDAYIIKRRKLYLLAALKDEPQFRPGEGFIYGGGSIIVGAMLEKIMGKTYEKLMKQYVFDPLGMTRSGYGPLSSESTLNGLWEHEYDSQKNKVRPWKPVSFYTLEPHSPAGRNGHSSIEDLGKFMAESMLYTTNKFLLNRSVLGTSQNLWMGDRYSAGGWAKGDKHIWHTGTNGRNYSAVRIYPTKLMGVAAMSNIHTNKNGPVGDNAVGELLQEMEIMHEKWNDLFDIPKP